jgi:hypothetical protein
MRERVCSQLRWRDKPRDPSRHISGRHWPGDEIALCNFTPQSQQQLPVLDTLQSLSNHLPAKRSGQANDRHGQGQIITIINDVAHERLVDLDGLGLQSLEVAQGRITGAKVTQ